MRIAYLTMDEVNTDLARRWADLINADVFPLSPRDPLPDGNYDAAIYDVDLLPAALREQVLTMLLTGQIHSPTAVHSYNFRRREVVALRARGVIVQRRLEGCILLRLRREVRRIRTEQQLTRIATLPAPRREKYDSIVPGTPTTSLGA